MELYNDDTRHGFEHTLGWLRQWACSRSFGLGTWRAPTRSLYCSSCPHDLASRQARHSSSTSVVRSPAAKLHLTSRMLNRGNHLPVELLVQL